jgi:hypothetical protein
MLLLAGFGFQPNRKVTWVQRREGMDGGDLLIDTFYIFLVLALGAAVRLLLFFLPLCSFDGLEDIILNEYA